MMTEGERRLVHVRNRSRSTTIPEQSVQTSLSQKGIEIKGRESEKEGERDGSLRFRMT